MFHGQPRSPLIMHRRALIQDWAFVSDSRVDAQGCLSPDAGATALRGLRFEDERPWEDVLCESHAVVDSA